MCCTLDAAVWARPASRGCVSGGDAAMWGAEDMPCFLPGLVSSVEKACVLPGGIGFLEGLVALLLVSARLPRRSSAKLRVLHAGEAFWLARCKTPTSTHPPTVSTQQKALQHACLKMTTSTCHQHATEGPPARMLRGKAPRVSWHAFENVLRHRTYSHTTPAGSVWEWHSSLHPMLCNLVASRHINKAADRVKRTA